MISIAILAPANAQAQSIWRYLGRVDILASIYRYTITGTDVVANAPFSGTFTSIGSGVGFNVPFYHIERELTLGINPNIEVVGVPGTAAEVEGRIPLTLSLEAPIYTTIKYGTDATWNAQSKIGFAAGIGVHYTALTTLDPADISTSFIAPAIMAEVSFRLGSGLMKLRYSTILGTTETDINGIDGSDGGDASLHQQAFHLILNFNS